MVQRRQQLLPPSSSSSGPRSTLWRQQQLLLGMVVCQHPVLGLHALLLLVTQQPMLPMHTVMLAAVAGVSRVWQQRLRQRLLRLQQQAWVLLAVSSLVVVVLAAGSRMCTGGRTRRPRLETLV